METGLTDAGHRHVRQSHVRLDSTIWFSPPADAGRGPIKTLEACRFNPGGHRSICIARRHAGYAPICCDPRWADDEKFIGSKFLSVTNDASAICSRLIPFIEAV